MNHLPRPIVMITLICLVLAPLLLLDVIPFLRGGELFNWLWPHKWVGIAQTLKLVIATALYGAAAYWAARRISARWSLLVAFLGGVLLPVVVISLRYDNPILELFNRTVSPVVTGPHLVAAQLDWGDVEAWFDWTSVMEYYGGYDQNAVSIHMALSPPGLPMIYGGINQILEWLPDVSNALYGALLPNQCHNSNMFHYTPAEWASLWFGMLMPVWTALMVLPFYAVARRLMDAAHARWMALLWVIVPTVVMMSPVWNIVYPIFCILAFWLLMLGMEKRRGEIYWLLAGLITALLTFANLSVVPVAMLYGFYALLHYLLNERESRPWYRPVVVGIWFGIGALGFWLVYTLITGTTPFEILDQSFAKHLQLERPYIPWLWMHAWEWALLGSLPCVLVWLWGLPRFVRRNVNALPLALFCTLVVLLLSNTARGETGRVWLFFTPFAMLSAGMVITSIQKSNPLSSSSIQNLEKGQGLRVWLPLLIAQAALMIALATTWDTMFAPDIRPTPPPPAPYENAIPQDVLFGDMFRLVGWHAETENNLIRLHLNYRANRQLSIPYWFAVLPVAPDGSTPMAAFVWQPNATRYPTTCWQPEQIVGDTVEVQLPENAPSGDWWLSLVAFPDATDPMNRLMITLPDGTQDTQIGLGPVKVGEAQSD